MRRFAYPVVALLIALLFWLHWRRTEQAAAERASAARQLRTPPSEIKTGAPVRAPAPETTLGAASAADTPLSAPLNAPDSTIARDLDALAQILDAWRTSFPREGNPVGENPEITAALTGVNPLGLVLIPKKHRAIDERGELCDRWGTPFRFHQLSGHHMELRSAGPDRKFGTDDDALWSPGVR